MVQVGSLIGLIVFYSIIFVIGVVAAWKKTRQKTSQGKSETMVVANRDINLFLGIFTMTAVYVGGGLINGTAEIIFSNGILWAQAPIGYAISGVIGGLFFVKPMRDKRYVTMLDPFQEKYGKYVGAVLYIPAVVGEIFWSAAILASLGATLQVIIELNFTIAVIISAVVAVTYTFFGGQYSVCYTDAAQLVLMTFGLVLCTPFAWNSPYLIWNELANHNSSSNFPNDSSTASSNLTMSSRDWIGEIKPFQIARYIDEYLLIIAGGIPWQDYFLRALSAKSSRNAQFVSISSMFLILAFCIPPALLGYIAVYTDWDAAGYNYTMLKENAPLVVPLVFQYLTPYFVAICGLGAVAAGVMSSTDAAVLSASSMFSHNVYKTIIRPNASDTEITWVLRIGFIISGILASVLAIYDHSVYYLLVFCSDFVYVILFPQLVCVLFVPLVNSYGVLTGSFVALILRLLGGEQMLFIPPVLKYPYFDYATNVQVFPFKTFAVLINFVVTIGVSILTNSLRKYASEKNRISDVFKVGKYQVTKTAF